MLNKDHLNQSLGSFLRGNIKEVVLAVSCGDDFWLGANGNMKADSHYFIASSTKLYVTAMVLQLIDSGHLQFYDPVKKFLPPTVFNGLHVIDGVDRSDQITIEHLLSHTSGLPDYFQAKRSGQNSRLQDILKGRDQKWGLEEVVKDSKDMGAVFAPNTERALYSDTNFQLLGSILEGISGKKLSRLIDQNVCQRLGLNNTYLYEDEFDHRPIALNFRSHVLHIPKAMTSFAADGGIVSNATDGILFLKGFFSGQLFKLKHLEYLTRRWRSIFYPLQYGVGISLFRLPWYFSPFKRTPDLIGHSGLSGAFLFYCPNKNIYLSGTVNQIARPATSFRLMLKAIS